jgi:hypothetical protein
MSKLKQNNMGSTISESAMGEIDILIQQSKTFKDFVKEFHKEYSLIELDREALKWLESLYNKKNESIKEADEKSPEEIVMGLRQMAMGDLERIADYANMILERLNKGEELSSWMYSQITLAVDQLNSVHDSLDGKDGVKESVNRPKTYKRGDKLKIKLPNGKQFDVVFVDYSNTKGMAYGKFKVDGEVATKPFSLSSIVESVNKVGTVSKDGLERVAQGLPQTEEEPINEWKAEEVLQQLGGRKFIAMTGAKNFAKNDPKKQITFKIGGGAKGGINYVRITLTSMDLYNIEFLKARGTDLKVVAMEKGVYNDQLQQMFTKHTGMNTKM